MLPAKQNFKVNELFLLREKLKNKIVLYNLQCQTTKWKENARDEFKCNELAPSHVDKSIDM